MNTLTLTTTRLISRRLPVPSRLCYITPHFPHPNTKRRASASYDHEPQRNGEGRYRDKEKKRSRVNLRYLIPITVVVATALVYTVNDLQSSNTRKGPFDAPRFTDFTITNREVVSSTSIILTLRPPPDILAAEDNMDPYKQYWEQGIWSVEVKRPDIMIARSYTPLPPLPSIPPGDLRFLIRWEKGGEMSNWLWGLKVGEGIGLRGPKSEFEIGEGVRDVVFLAGGTGVVGALGCVYTLLSRPETNSKVHIIWANRRREDCDDASPVIKQIRMLQERFPGRLELTCVVDEENSFITQKIVGKALKGREEVKSQPIISRIDERLVLVSGPEGFVEFVAGRKVWDGGVERQGVLGGVLGRLGVRDWKVWKL